MTEASERLNENVTRLEGVMDELEKRLDPILTPRVPDLET